MKFHSLYFALNYILNAVLCKHFLLSNLCSSDFRWSDFRSFLGSKLYFEKSWAIFIFAIAIGMWRILYKSLHIFLNIYLVEIHQKYDHCQYILKDFWCVCVHAKSLQSCPTLCDPTAPPGASVHEILQARTLEWVAMLSRGSFWPRDRNCISYISCIGSFFFFNH